MLPCLLEVISSANTVHTAASELLPDRQWLLQPANRKVMCADEPAGTDTPEVSSNQLMCQKAPVVVNQAPSRNLY